ncbi:6-phospho-3-hexuloisomerase [Tetragenococcus osmophilus]|uniref:6-phospho-3-hexuloisomerase n=1 Tax=Tetragenococcus osmophilus TaxID=526944 RepID=A0AA37XL18_9ENTE|nr:6-phospho-3-hexuloisomerase [Tetragenococcus osmophilus]AYW48293.1 6-phospho-3-hexuloisomerase [Tetragenococcus osmophilus]GMA72016.1 6-phospho 3-hexuloisomerase [Tetragenococcus osmophilus]
MNSVDTAYQAATELADTLKRIDKSQIEELTAAICQSNRIFVAGAGRSLLMLKGFAMRLMHIGFEVYVVGDVTTPAFLSGDLLILASASGETNSLVSNASKAKTCEGRVITLTVFEQSTLADLSDKVVRIPAYTDKLPASQENKKGILPGGSTFEEAVLVLGDALIVELAQEYKVDTDKAFVNHANLE